MYGLSVGTLPGRLSNIRLRELLRRSELLVTSRLITNMIRGDRSILSSDTQSTAMYIQTRMGSDTRRISPDTQSITSEPQNITPDTQHISSDNQSISSDSTPQM